MPRGGNLQSSRPAFYDRNAEQKYQRGGGFVDENTSEAELWTYTVPSSHKAFVTAAQVGILTMTAATSTTEDDRVIARVAYTESGGSEQTFLAAQMASQHMSGNDRSYNQIGGDSIMLAGDKLRGLHLFEGDAAGAGRVLTEVSAAITEFDA